MKINDIKRALRKPTYSQPGDEELRDQHVQVVRQVTDLQNALTAASAISPLTTKGDVWIFDTVDDRLAIGTNGQVLTADSAQAKGMKWAAPATAGTVTSVGLSLPAEFLTSGSPVTAAGTLAGAWANEAANVVLSGPSSGGAAAPTFRALVAADINPALPETTKGDLLGFTTVPARIPVGSNTQVLTADSTQALGVKWAAASGGSVSPLTTKGDVWGFSSVDARIPVGTNGQALVADSTQTLGVKWATTTFKRMVVETSGAYNGSNKVFVWEAFVSDSETLFINGVATDTADYSVTNTATGEITLGAVLPAPVSGDELRLTYATSAVSVGLPSAHNLLSSSHADTLPANAVRGDIVVANSTPAWSKLAAGSVNKVLTMGASDPAWATLTNTGGGNTVATGTEAARAAAGTAGNLYLPTDSHGIDRDNGASYDKWGPVYALGAMPAFAWRNQGTATVDTTREGEYMTVTSSAGAYALRIREIAWPSPPFRVQVLLKWCWDLTDYQHVSLCFNDGTKVKSLGFWSNGANGVFRGDNWTNVTTYSGVIGANSVVLSPPYRQGNNNFYISIYDDNAGTPKWHYSYSPDGYYWQDLLVENRNTFLTPTKIGWMSFFNGAGSLTTYGSILSWKQTAS